MNQNEKKEIMGKFAKKLENAIKREVAVTKEIENDTWTISERQKHVLMKRMMGIEKGTIFDN